MNANSSSIRQLCIDHMTADYMSFSHITLLPCFGGDSIQYDCEISAQYDRGESRHYECESPIDMYVV